MVAHPAANGSFPRKNLEMRRGMLYNEWCIMKFHIGGISVMKHIKPISEPCLRQSLAHGGCGECQSSCQSACKTSCGIANQPCEKTDK